jgi:hypothetical protein
MEVVSYVPYKRAKYWWIFSILGDTEMIKADKFYNFEYALFTMLKFVLFFL